MPSGAWLLVVSLALQTPPAPATHAPADRPFADLFTNLVTDIRALPSADTALFLGVGSASALVLHRADDNLFRWADTRGDSGYTDLGRLLGDGWTQAGGAVGTYAIGRLVHDGQLTHMGSDLIRGQFLNALVTRGAKVLAQRARPSGGHDSFPSGHSSAAFTSAAILDAHYGWKAGVPAYAVAGFIGWTRVRDNAHWLTDVVMGGTLGTIVGRAVTVGHPDRPWAIVPTANRQMTGIYFVRRWRARS
jgi:membrane-associated phospholipid phosphatase